jgi:hypothetical protein
MDDLDQRLRHHWNNLVESELVRRKDPSDENIRTFEGVLNRIVPITDLEKNASLVVRFISHGSSDDFARLLSAAKKQHFTLLADGVTICHALRLQDVVVIRWDNTTRQYTVREKSADDDAPRAVRTGGEKPQRRGGSNEPKRGYQQKGRRGRDRRKGPAERSGGAAEHRGDSDDEGNHHRNTHEDESETRTSIPPLGKSAALEILDDVGGAKVSSAWGDSEPNE